MQKIDGTNWLTKPWRRMGHKDFYRYYQFRNKENTYERFLLVIRTSDKCYQCTTWKQYFNGYTKSEIDKISLRSFWHVKNYAAELIKGE